MIKFHSLLKSVLCGLYMTVFGIAFAAPGVFTTTTQDGRIVTITIINDDIIKVSNTSEEVPVSRSVILAPTDFAGEAMAVGGKQIVTTATGVGVP